MSNPPQPSSPNVTSPSPIASATVTLTAATKDGIQWTVGRVFATIGVFLLAGLAEIGGGWLVWQTIRNKKPWYYCFSGFIVLMSYGVIPTLQPEGATFSRTYAVYGGIFVVMSYGWGWLVDGDRPDKGDWVGAGIALAGVAAAWFWPR